MPPSLWQRGLVSVMATLIAACALLLSPPERTESLRRIVRDALAPGARAVIAVREWTGRAGDAAQRSLTDLASPSDAVESSRLTAVAAERDAALAAIAELESQVASLRSELAAAREAEQQFLVREPATPLVQTVAVPARVLGSDATAAQLADRLIDAGSSSGLAAGDLVLATPAGEATVATAELLIDQGANAALQPDLPVTARGSLVGRIHQCGEWTSTVQRVTDPEFRVGARLVRSTPDGPVFGAGGVYAGRGDAAGELNFVPGTEPAAVGDRVYTQEHVAGESLQLLIGTVATAELAPGEPHWRITVTPAAADPGLRVDVLKAALNPERLAAHQPVDETVTEEAKR